MLQTLNIAWNGLEDEGGERSFRGLAPWARARRHAAQEVFALQAGKVVQFRGCE